MSKKILIVDDEKDILGWLQLTLENAGYEVDTANGGEQCLLKLGNDNFDLVLLDMFMPQMSGRETFEHIIIDTKLKKTKIVFFTVSENEEVKRQLMKQGAADYIVKPIKGKELIARLKKVLSG
jgi:DNA-binding response OmpR family regulator